MKKFIFKIYFICVFLQVSNAVQGQVTIGSESAPSTGALLQMKETDNNGTNSTKGMLLPRVALTDIYALEPCAETNEANKIAHTGMMVYNTTTDSTGVLKENIYAWNGERWRSQKVEEGEGRGSTNDMVKDITTSGYNANNIAKGTVIEFIDPLLVKTAGFYMFSLRLYGRYVGPTTLSSGYAFYVGLFRKAQGTDVEIMVDCAEINLVKSSLDVTTYAVNLGGEFDYGDTAVLRIAHHPTAGTQMVLLKAQRPLGANKTSLIWWKL